MSCVANAGWGGGGGGGDYCGRAECVSGGRDCVLLAVDVLKIPVFGVGDRLSVTANRQPKLKTLRFDEFDFGHLAGL